MGWHVPAEGRLDGEADRERPPQRTVRALGPADIAGLDPLPAAVNPARSPNWGVDSFVLFPNFMLLVWAPGWYTTYPTTGRPPTTRTSSRGPSTSCPPKNATERLRQELAAVTFKEYALQDANTLEATQSMIESRAVAEFPLNDQEILLRHLHRTARGYVADFEKSGTSPNLPATR